MRTRIRVRMAGNDITLRDVISVYVVTQIERQGCPDLVSMRRNMGAHRSRPRIRVLNRNPRRNRRYEMETL